jgi:hypothetical protein
MLVLLLVAICTDVCGFEEFMVAQATDCTVLPIRFEHALPECL